jgi:hypothetical protein
VITIDSNPSVGYDYDFRGRPQYRIDDARSHWRPVVRHSMGTGKITRYVGKYGTKRIRKAVLIGTLVHYLVKALEICYTVEVDLESYTLVNTPMDPPSLRRIAALLPRTTSDIVRHAFLVILWTRTKTLLS